LKVSERIEPLLFIFLAVTFLGSGCALRKQNSANPAPSASAAPSITPRCSDRVDRAKTGGFVGSVLGTIAASVIGSPFLGVFYQTAGYVMGFASSSPCPSTNSQPQSSESLKAADPPPGATIGEEDL